METTETTNETQMSRGFHDWGAASVCNVGKVAMYRNDLQGLLPHCSRNAHALNAPTQNSIVDG